MIRICEDLELGRSLWNELPGRGDRLFDLWEVRLCFQEGYGRTPLFIYSLDGSGKADGLLALSRLEETGGAAFFPGETWKNRTWLEGNRILARDASVLGRLLAEVPGPANLRYLELSTLPEGAAGAAEDEIRYVFVPSDYNFSFSAYRESFPRQRLKRIGRELDRLEAQGAEFRSGETRDIDLLLEMNLAAFKEYSYFSDPRFLRGFQRLVAWLHDRGALRVTTALIGGKVAAVDVGAVWENAYTVMAGGTNPEFPGVAKLINFRHIDTACRERFASVDFLCGDFGWKERFLLTPRPLYQISVGQPHPVPSPAHV